MGDLVWNIDGADWPNRDASIFVEASGFRWHVQRKGQGPHLLLVHGVSGATHSWRGLAPLLAQKFTVTSFDLPGHGFTDKPAAHRLSLNGMAADIGALLKVMAIEPVIAVGHSAGAAIVARMCLDGRISPRLFVSINGAFFPFPGAAGHLFSPLAKLLAFNPLVPRFFAWQASTPNAVERLMQATGSQIDAAGIADYRKLVQSPAHVKAALQMMANWKLEPLVADLPKLKTRLVLIAADNDRAVPPQVAQSVRDLVSGSKLVMMHGGGHLAHEEKPDVVAAHIMKAAAQTNLADEKTIGSVK